jgi:hypothetical protein
LVNVMSQVIQIPSAVVRKPETESADRTSPAIRTETVYVVFTSIDETLAAARVAHRLAGAMGVPLTIIHFRAVPYALPVDEPTGVSPVETEAFVARLRAEGVNARVRVYLCRDKRQTIAYAFKPHSLIVMAGQHRWWPTLSERWCRTLEAAGHFVVFVDTSDSSTRLRVAPDRPRGDEQEASRA